MLKERLRELDELVAEIETLSRRLRDLRGRRDRVEQDIVELMKSKNHSGVRYRGRAIFLEQKEKRGRLTDKQRRSNALRVLEDAGVDDPESLLEELTEARRGSPEVRSGCV